MTSRAERKVFDSLGFFFVWVFFDLLVELKGVCRRRRERRVRVPRKKVFVVFNLTQKRLTNLSFDEGARGKTASKAKASTKPTRSGRKKRGKGMLSPVLLFS